MLFNKEPHCPRLEGVGACGGSGAYGPVSSPRGQQVKQVGRYAPEVLKYASASSLH